MSFRRLALLALAFVLAGCGSSGVPSSPVSVFPSPSTVSVAPSAQSSSAPAPIPSSSELVGITQGLILAGCETVAGTTYVNVTQYSPPAKAVERTITFAWPSDGQNYRSNAKCTSDYRRGGFNQDFTRLFVSAEEAGTDAVTIGYLSPQPETKVVTLTNKPDEFTAVKNGVPFYHPGTGRIYYCNNAKTPSAMMSMDIDGLRIKPEAELQKLLPRGECADPVLVDATLPVIKPEGADVVYDRTGTASVSVTGTSLTVKKKGYEKTYKLSVSDFGSRDLVLVGFIDESSVVFTDTQKIYLATLSGSIAKVTTLLDNTVEANEIVDVMISASGGQIAFISQNGPSIKLYSLNIENLENLEAPVRTELGDLSSDEYRIVQFN